MKAITSRQHLFNYAVPVLVAAALVVVAGKLVTGIPQYPSPARTCAEDAPAAQPAEISQRGKVRTGTDAAGADLPNAGGRARSGEQDIAQADAAVTYVRCQTTAP